MRYNNVKSIVLCLLLAGVMYAIDEMVGVVLFLIVANVLAVMHGKRKIKIRD